MRRFAAMIWTVLLLAAAVFPASADVNEDAYDSIVNFYQMALSGEDPAEVSGALENLVRYYQKYEEGLSAHLDALYYYSFAAGYLAFENGEYYEAHQYLQLLEGLPIEAESGSKYYLLFSEAMLNEQLGAYAVALALLKEAQPLTASPAACIAEIEKVRQLYQDDVKTRGEALCIQGRHADARALYQELIDSEDIDFKLTGMALYNACMAHGDKSEQEKLWEQEWTEAQKAYNAGKYQDAAYLFRLLKDNTVYPDCDLWAEFCDGMLLIVEADDDEAQGYLSDAKASIAEAREIMKWLSGAGFTEAGPIYSYCMAREYEYKSLKQKAEDEYANLPRVLDADARLSRLRGNGAMPTQAPQKKQAPLLQPVPAKTSRQTELYAGPGKDYARYTDVTLNGESSFGICARQEAGGSKWYLLEMETDKGKIRLWANNNGMIYPLENGKTELVMQKSARRYVTQFSEVRMGPGKEYAEAEGIRLEANAKVTAYDEEGAYTLIELENAAGEKLCGWILTEHLK